MANKFFWLSASFVLALAGCGGSSPSGLQLKINEERDALVWDAVAGASGYEIDVDGVKDLKINPRYDFSTTVGKHKVTVTVIDENDGRGLSSSFDFETRESSLSDLSIADKKITWSSASTCGLEYKVDDGEFTPVTGDYIPAEKSGLYTVVAPKKINDQHVFYNKKVEKYIVVNNDAEDEYILEDATAPDDASLSELYAKTKYTNNGWVDAASDVSLDKNSGAYITGNAADYKFWRQDVYYKFSKQISLDGAYNEISFSMKSEEAVDAYLAFEVGHTMIVGNMNLNGVYITYPIPEAPTKWTHYRVTLDDPKWVVTFNGMKLPFSQIKETVKGYGFYVDKLADFLPYFDTFQLRLRGMHDDNWSTCHAYFDDIKLVNSDLVATEVSPIIPNISLFDTYAFKSDSIASGSLSVNGNEGVFNVPALSLSIPVTCSIADNKATITSTESGKDFVAVFSSMDAGMTLDLESVTGTLAPYFTNIVVEAVSKLDDFESYTSTGVGLDKDHPNEEQTSGLRKAYYSDWYDEAGKEKEPRSLVGDSNWGAMRSSDYLKLREGTAHTGNKSMDLKTGTNPCRYMSDGLRTGDSKAYKGKYLSLWMKNELSADATVIICAYSTNKLDATNHVSDAVRKVLTITADHTDTSWHEVKIELDESKTYYGFSILTKNGPNPAGRILVDDVYIFSNLSPWGK